MKHKIITLFVALVAYAGTMFADTEKHEQKARTPMREERVQKQARAFSVEHALPMKSSQTNSVNYIARNTSIDATDYPMWMPLVDYFPDVMEYTIKGAVTELSLFTSGVKDKENPKPGIEYKFFLHVKKEANWSGTFLYDTNHYSIGSFSGKVYYYQANGDIWDYDMMGGNITISQRHEFVDVWFEIHDRYNRSHKHHYWYKNKVCETTNNSSGIVALTVDQMLSQIAYSSSGIQPVPMMVKGVVKDVTDGFYFNMTLQDGTKTLPCYEMLGYYRSDSAAMFNLESYTDKYRPGDTVIAIVHRYYDIFEPQTRYGFVYKHYPQDESKMNFTPTNFNVSVHYGRADYTWSANDGYRWEIYTNWEDHTHYSDEPSYEVYTNNTDDNSYVTDYIKVRAVDKYGNPKSEWSNAVYYTINGENPYAVQDLERTQEDGVQHFHWNWDKIPDDFYVRVWNNNTNKLIYRDTGKDGGSIPTYVDFAFILDIPASYHVEIYPIVKDETVALETIDFYFSSGTDYTPNNLQMEMNDDKINCSWKSSADHFEVKLYHYGKEIDSQETTVPSATFTGKTDGAYYFTVKAWNSYSGSIKRSLGTGTYMSSTEWLHYYRFFKFEPETEGTRKKNDAIYYGTHENESGYIQSYTSFGYYKTSTGELLLREGSPHVMLFAHGYTGWDEFNEWETGLTSQGRVLLPIKKKHIDGRFKITKKFKLEVHSSGDGRVVTKNRYNKIVTYHGGWYPAGSPSPVFWAEPATRFLRWSDHNDERTSIAQQIILNKSYNLTAFFTGQQEDPDTPTGKVKLKVLSSSDKMGSVNDKVGGIYDLGTPVTITALPKDNYIFDFWNDGENPEDKQVTRTITLTQDTTFVAHFTPDSASITIKSNNEIYGIVNSEINGRYPKGTILTLKATPTDTTTLKQWSTGQISLTWTLKLTQDTVITAFFDLLTNINYAPYDLWAWRQPKEVTTNYGGHIFSGNIDIGWSVQDRAPEYNVTLWYLFTNPETQQDNVEWADEWTVDTITHNFLLNEDSIWTYSVQPGKWEDVYDEETNEYTSVWQPLSEAVWYYFNYLHDKDGIQQPAFFTRVDTILPRDMRVTTEDSCTYRFEWDIKYKTEPFTYAIDIFTHDYTLLKTDTVAGTTYSYSFCRKDSMAWRVKPLFQRSLTEYVDLTYQYGPKFFTNPKDKNFDPFNLHTTFKNDTLQLCWEGEAPHFLVELVYAEGKPNEYSFIEYTDEHCIRFRIYDRGEYTWYVYPLDELYNDLSEKYFYETFTVNQTSYVQYELVVEDDGWCDVNSAEVNGMYEPYTIVTVVADIPDGNVFLGWSDGDLSNPRTIVMIKDLHITAITEWGKEGFEEVQGDNVRTIKILRNGHIYILRGGKTYTLQGIEIK